MVTEENRALGRNEIAPIFKTVGWRRDVFVDVEDAPPQPAAVVAIADQKRQKHASCNKSRHGERAFTLIRAGLPSEAIACSQRHPSAAR